MPADLVDELLVLDGLDAERATFVEPLACVLRAFERCGLRAGDSLLVVGCGTSGLLAVAAAHARAVEAVWAREPRPERLERALALGAERHGNELVDVVIVCTPKPDAIAAGFAAVAPGGALCLYAPPDPGHALGLDGHALYVGEVDVCASYSAGPADMRAALRPHRRRAGRSAALRHPPRRPRRDRPRARAGPQRRGDQGAGAP